MKTKKPIKSALTWLLAAVGLLFASGSQADTPDFSVLAPGQSIHVLEVLPVNIVFVGYQPGSAPNQIDPALFAQIMPNFADSQAYWKLNDYDGDGWIYFQPMGWTSIIRPHIQFADPIFEDAFFEHLIAIGKEAPVTDHQTLYNGQAARSLTIDHNFEIDAEAVERWLAENGHQLGIDTTKPTVFLVNWFGRPDFRFHVYRVGSMRDSDAGTSSDFLNYSSRKVSAWGGTAYNNPEVGSGIPYRVWFHDLSAGPEAWTNNWDITNAEPSGEYAPHPAVDGRMDYRMPPTWEYGNMGGYRPFVSVTYDLALITRFVAINQLFVAPALYDPWLSRTATAPEAIEIDHQQVQFPGGADATQLSEDRLVDALSGLRRFDVLSVEQNPKDATKDLIDLYDCWQEGWDSGESCYGQSTGGDFFNDLNTYFDRQRMRNLEGDADLEIMTVSLGIGDAQREWVLGLAGSVYTDTPYSSSPMTWVSQGVIDTGKGNTDVLIHEVAHHMGLSHPHDGIDVQAGIAHFGRNDFYFGWLGDFSSSVMGYLGGQSWVSQFDLDMFDRWMFGRYVNVANSVLPQILAHPGHGKYLSKLQAADGYLLRSIQALWSANYELGHYYARHAHSMVLSVARALNIRTDSDEGWQADYRGSFDNAPLLRSGGKANLDLHSALLEASAQTLPPVGDNVKLLQLY